MTGVHPVLHGESRGLARVPGRRDDPVYGSQQHQCARPPKRVMLGMCLSLMALITSARVTADGETRLLSVAPHSVDGVVMGGVAQELDSDSASVRLVPSREHQVGSCFSARKLEVGAFRTQFRFVIHSPNSYAAADGLVFVLAPTSGSLGWDGAYLGYASGGFFRNSLGIEFDIYDNGPGEFNDPNGSHVAIVENGLLSQRSSGPTPMVVADGLADGVPRDVWVDYADGMLEVRLGRSGVKPPLPLLADQVDIPRIVGGQEAFVGFVASTGSGAAVHDLVSWTYSVSRLSLPCITNRSFVIGAFSQERAGGGALINGWRMSAARASLAVAFPSVDLLGITDLAVASLGAVDALVLSTASEPVASSAPLSLQEQSALWRFVVNGGSVLLLTDNDSVTPIANAAILDLFDVTTAGTTLSDCGIVRDHPIVSGPHGTVDSISQNFAGGFSKLGRYAVALATNTVGVALAVIEAQVLGPDAGRVILSSDTNFLWDDDASGRFSENKVLFLNMIAYCRRPLCDGPVINSAPTISRIEALSVLEDLTSEPVTFAVSDDKTAVAALKVGATSWSEALLPGQGLILDGVEGERTLTVTPAKDQYGQGMVMVVVEDEAGLSRGSTFEVTVLPVNDPPTLAALADVVMREGSGPVTVPLTGITAGPANEVQALSVTANSDRVELLPPPAVSYVSPNKLGSLRLEPVSGRAGSALVTVQVRDDGGTARGGVDVASRQFRVTVVANQPPTVTLTGPGDGEVFEAPAAIPLRATAADGDGTISRVEFFGNGGLLATDLSLPFEWSWTGVTAGEYVLRVRATDNNGAMADSATVKVTVREGLGLTLTSPAVGTVYCPGTAVVLAATVSGPMPSGSQVEFEIDGAVVGRVRNLPLTWLEAEGMAPGAHEVRARLLDGSGVLRAESARVVVEVLAACADVAILRNYADPEVERMRSLLEGERLGYAVEVFDRGEVNLERLLGYKLVIWAGLEREGEGLTDSEVELLASLQAAGKSLYLLGPRVLGDTGRLSVGSRARFEELCGMRGSGGVVQDGVLEALIEGHGDPILQGPFGSLGEGTVAVGRTELGEVTVQEGVQVKLQVGGAPVMVVSPAVCEPDLGQARWATQSFGLGVGAAMEGLFRSTVLWLMRGWLCENMELKLVAGEAPAVGRVGEVLEYEYRVQHRGACAAVGVVLSEELPAGWLVEGVEMTRGSWAQVGPWLVETVGCMDGGREQAVRWRLIPTRAGSFTHGVRVGAAREPFKAEVHEVMVRTTVEGSELAPRLELRVQAGSGSRELWVFGAAGVSYRVQRSGDLRGWEEYGRAVGPEARLVLGPNVTNDTTQYFRALCP